MHGFRNISAVHQWYLASKKPHSTSLVNTVWRVNISRPDAVRRSTASGWQNVGGDNTPLGMFAGAASHINLARQSPPLGSSWPSWGQENHRRSSLGKRLGRGAAQRYPSSASVVFSVGSSRRICYIVLFWKIIVNYYKKAVWVNV